MFRLINNLKNKKGFTLIELIVVLAVLAVIMAIAVPRFVGVQEQAKIDADYSTGSLIAKAAEIYAVKGDLTEGEILAKLADDFPQGIDFQSEEIDGKDLDDVVLEITKATGEVKVSVKTTDEHKVEIYPGKGLDD